MSRPDDYEGFKTVRDANQADSMLILLLGVGLIFALILAASIAGYLS